MSRGGIYYIRPNHTDKLPANILILDTETVGDQQGDVEMHTMQLGWTWRMHLDDELNVSRESWREWFDTESLGAYVESEARVKAPLWVLGSNITFDLFASGLAQWFQQRDWTCSILYDKGVTTIIRLDNGSRRVTFLAVQNFLTGGVGSWGDMLGLPKLDVSFEEATPEELSIYCRRDTEITGQAFLQWLRFVRDHDMGGFAHTRASQAFRCWRHRFLTDKVLHYDQPAHNTYVRRAYYGGRVEAGLIGTMEGEQLVKLDVNSMYPSVMATEHYPTRLRQWKPKPTHAWVEKKLQTKCCVAEVELDTDEPAYPLRDNGKLLFPLGRFRAFLPSASLSYALSRGHVVSISSCMVFDRARLFPAFVEEWYKLRQRYKRQGNAIYEQICKLVLNSLYGKFGELRERVISEGDDPSRDFYRRQCSVPTELAYDQPDELDWHYDPASYPTTSHVHGSEWAAWGKFQVTAGQDEGPMSMPAIAAHVTDHGRMLLYGYMAQVGVARVLYCDTDSLIVRASDLPKLEGSIDETRLGALKVEDTADSLIVHGAKDYVFSDSVRRKGIRSDAVPTEDGGMSQAAFPGLFSLMRRGCVDGFPIGSVTRHRRTPYNKGAVASDGSVTPHRYPRAT